MFYNITILVYILNRLITKLEKLHETFTMPATCNMYVNDSDDSLFFIIWYFDVADCLWTLIVVGC